MTTYSSGNALATYHYLKDHQNSIIALTDSSGTVVETYEYDAYGNTKVFDTSGTELTTSSFGNRYAFQGREIDWETGLYYFRARWYDPEIGRWLSKDPIGIRGGLNLYVAFGNNPVNFVDHFGLDEDSGWWKKTVNWVKDKVPFINPFERFKDAMEKRSEGYDDMWKGDLEGGQDKVQQGGMEAAQAIHDIAMDATDIPGTSLSLGTPGAKSSR